MARPVRGSELVEMAREMIAQAQTAEAIGRSRVWTCRLRNRFLAGQTCGDGQRQRRGGRRRQIMSPEQ
ncbi:MAG: hypothetical protein ACK58C_08740, partial [Betaproteobacteria bacterium]